VDHAYWVSGLRLRNAAGAGPLGTIDVRSEGFGVGDPVPGSTQTGGGTETGGNVPAIGYQSLFKTWGPAPTTPVRDRLNIDAKNLKTVTVNVKRARVSCDVFLHVTTDGPVTVRLPGCGQKATFAKSGDSPGACSDRLAPRVSFGRKGVSRRHHGRVRLLGRAFDRGCKASGGRRGSRGHVSRVLVSVAKAANGRCRFLRKSGKLTPARSCAKPLFVRAKGTRRWRLRSREGMPKGHYRIRAKAFDAAGNRSRTRRVRVQLL
jgi:hypothetical protein